MRILWLTNIPLPEASLLMNEKPTSAGGWLIGASKHILENSNFELIITFPKQGLNDIIILKGEKIKYYVYPKVDSLDISSFKKNVYLEAILNEVYPDLVHIFGTEYGHSLAMINECKKIGIKTVVSLQGLVSVIAKHYTSSLPIKIQKKYTFRDFVKQDNILQQQKKFTKRGFLEVEAIKKTDHIIGRTTWDRVCSYLISSKAQYHFCNETLREEFYKHKWSYQTCEKYTIFVSQGSYPIKGLHYIIEALHLVVKKFPQAKLYIAGPNIIKDNSFKDKLKSTSYAYYIKQLIYKYDLADKIYFTGNLDEREMCQRYLRSNIYVCPSSIENSPNSLGEAMLLGVPCIASYVGGIPDMLTDYKEGFLYQYDAPYMLAHYICVLFSDEKTVLRFSQNARKRAKKTHDREENTKRLIQIYEEICRQFC